MKELFHKVISFSMAIVVLFSTMSFTVNMHDCGDTLVETAVFKKAKGCGMEMLNPLKEGCTITKKNCCNDEEFVVDGQDELQFQVDKISLEQQMFIVAFTQTYINLFDDIGKEVTTYKTYKPPLVIRQLYKIDETYLI